MHLSLPAYLPGNASKISGKLREIWIIGSSLVIWNVRATLINKKNKKSQSSVKSVTQKKTAKIYEPFIMLLLYIQHVMSRLEGPPPPLERPTFKISQLISDISVQLSGHPAFADAGQQYRCATLASTTPGMPFRDHWTAECGSLVFDCCGKKWKCLSKPTVIYVSQV